MILLRHLMNILLSELEVQDELLGLLIRERVAIVKRSQDEMDAVLGERELVERKLENLVSRRENMLRALENEMRLGRGRLSLDDLTAVDDGELQLLGESLSTAFDTIFEMRKQNKAMRQQSIGIVQPQ